ncbi:MAG: transglutaminase domain-containing protein [Clostridia bacterium]|nr:transglutaminase domain-containing protein [Clostridia bacterium]
MKRTKLLNIISSMLIGVIFMIVMLLVMVISGVITVKRTQLLFSTESATAVYDGKPLTNHTWHLESGELKAGHKISVVFTGEQTSAGESDNTIQVQIFDAANADVTGDYSISYRLGSLKVTPRTLSVKSEGATKAYDGTMLTNSKYEVNSLVPGHTALVVVTGTQTQVGFSPNTIGLVTVFDRAGRDVTNNYYITKTEGPLIVTGEGGGNMPGGADFGSGNDFIGPGVLQNMILYKVFSDKTGRIYLKNKSFGDYTGGGFAEAKRYTGLLDGKYSASYLTSFALEAKGAEMGKVTIERTEMGPYALPYYMCGTVYDGYTVQTDDVEILGAATKYSSDYYLGSTMPDSHGSYMFREYESEYSKFVYANYLSIDAETLAYMQGIIADNGFIAADSEIINKVAAFIQASAEYDMAYDRGLDASPNIAVSFLRDYKKGVCRHYAMAATMLYRALGIPARYTVGAVADAKAGEWVEVNALQYHAWVEVYIDGIGWQMVEVTGGASAGGSGGAGGGGASLGGGGSQVNPVELEKIILYRVYSNKGGLVYLKSESFGEYNGKGFDEAKAYPVLLGGKYSAEYLTPLALKASGADMGNMIIENVESSAYALPYYIAETTSRGYDIQTSDVKYSGDASRYYVGHYLDNVQPTAHTNYDYVAFEADYRQFVRDQYTKIDDETKSFLLDFISDKGISADDTDVISKVAELIKSSASYNLKYDTAMDEANNTVIAFLRDYKEGVCRHYSAAATMLYRALGIPARYTVGVVAQTEQSKWAEVNALQAHAWVEVYIDGIGWQMVEVTGGAGGPGGPGGSDNPGGEQPKPDKRIGISKVTKRYDGTPLYAEAKITGFEKYAAEGYTYTNLTVSGSRTEVGVSTSKIETITIYDKDKNDVTSEFELGTGKIHVYYWEIDVISNSAEFVYGDIAAQNNSQAITVTGDVIQANHKYSVKYNAKYTAGSNVNSFTISITDEDGKDISEYYKINIVYGKLNIKHREITVRSASDNKVYDGTPLINTGYDIEGTLADGDTVYICTVEGELINVGRAENIISEFVIHDANGNDVTKNYNVKKEHGQLRITRR